MTPPCVLINGCGIAGLAAAGRLAAAGWKVVVAGGTPVDRIVTLDRSVRELLVLEYGATIIGEIEPAVVEKRLLRWSTDRIESIDDRLLVVDLSRLSDAIGSRLPRHVEFSDTAPDPAGFDFVLDATGRGKRPQLVSGIRTAYVWTLPASTPGDDRALIASSDEGWVFAAPAPKARHLVQLLLPGKPRTVHEATEAAVKILADERFAGGALLAASVPVVVDATPCFTHPVAAQNRLRTGDAAAAGDPLAGEGVGRALRSAVLAAATLLRSADGDVARPFGNYAARIALAQAVHLRACAAFYAAACSSDAFAGQIATMTRHAHLLEALAAGCQPRMCLNASGVVPILAEMT